MTINIPETDQERMVIVGCGFAGLELAMRLRKSGMQVVILDKNNYHQFQPLFYQVAMAGLEPSSISFPIRKLVRSHPNTFFRICEVHSVDTDAKRISTSKGDLSYDHLVVAVGADTNFFGNKEIERKAIPMKSVAEALYLRNAILEDLEEAITTTDFEARQGLIDIVIVGGGATGVELAGALADMRKYIIPKDYPELNAEEIDIYLIQGGSCLLPGMSKKASEGAEKFLKKLEVEVRLKTRVTAYDGEYVHMKDGTKIRSKKVIWAAGICGNQLKGLPEDCSTYGKRLAVDSMNKVSNLESVYALGDIAYMETEAFPKGHPQVAQVAIQQARNLAKNFIRRKKGKPEKAFKYKDLGSMATVGRNLAVVDLPRYKFRGFFAWLVWMFVHLFALIGTKNRLFVFINWVWNYFTYDQSLRLIIRSKERKEEEAEE